MFILTDDMGWGDPSSFGNKEMATPNIDRLAQEGIAELEVNGKNLGILWKPPFAADITGAIQPGKNTVKIRVTNLWPNRLIGDEHLPADCGMADQEYAAHQRAAHVHNLASLEGGGSAASLWAAWAGTRRPDVGDNPSL